MAKFTQQGREAPGLMGEIGRLLSLMRVHRACMNSLAGPPQLASAGVSLGTGPEWQWWGDTEAVGKGFFRKTDTNAAHSKEAD